MRSLSFVGPLPASRSIETLSLKAKIVSQLLSTVTVMVAVLFAAGTSHAQTLVLNPAVTDLYSNGVVNFASTPVTQSVTQNVQLKVTGGAVTITSISVPTSTARTQQFKVGTVTGCTIGASNAANTICTVPVTFTPAYTGYQTSPLIAVTGSGTFRFGLNGSSTGPHAVLMPGVLSTYAGNGKVNGTAGTNLLQYTGDGGQATAAEVYSHGFAFDALGNLYEAEYNASVVREVNTAGVINTVAGTFTTAAGVETATQCATPTAAPYPTCVSNGANSLALNQATFGNSLSDVAFDSAGNLYIADTIEDRVRRVDASTGIITTIAGTGVIADSGDGGLATAAGLNVPESIVIDSQDNIYVLDSNAAQTINGATVRFINHATGNISTIAGIQGAPCAAGGAPCGDGGPATAANLGISAAFYVDSMTGNFWIADRDANRIRFVNFSNATPATAGTISTVAGNGTAGFTGDGGPATSAELNGPHGLWVDPAGDLYIGDRTNNRVRFVSKATGNISTLAGGGGTCTPGGSGTCGDGGPANGPNANLTPDNLLLDPNGNLFIADQQNNAIRKVIMNPTTLTFATVPVGTTSGPLTATLLNIGTAPLIFTDPATAGVSNALVTTTGPTAAASTAYAQTAATTCGPVFSTTSTNNTLAAGSTCNYVVAFTPDTAAGNYTGTLVETDNSAVSTTQLVSLVGAATQGTATVKLASSSNPSTYGQSVTFTASLTGGGIAPTGSVTFTYTPPGSTTPVSLGSFPLSSTGATSTASVTTAVLPVGVSNVIATYGGDANYVAGTASTPLAQTVSIEPVTNDSIAATPATTIPGQTVTLTFTVPDGTTPPAGTTSVTFTAVINGVTTTLGTAEVKGTQSGTNTIYTTSTTVLPVGTTTITGTYTGDGNYAGGSLATTETVGQQATTTTLTSAPNPSTSGQSVTFTATSAGIGATGNSPALTGTTTFYAAGSPQVVNLQSTPTSTTTFQTVTLPAGSYAVTILATTTTPAGLYSGWNSSASPTTNNLWTDRYGVEICAPNTATNSTCTESINVISGNPGYATDTAAFQAYGPTPDLQIGTGGLAGNPYIFTLTAPASVSLYVPDGTFSHGAFSANSFGDDSGGLSLGLTPLALLGTGTVGVGGVATYSTGALPLGTTNVVAAYGGDNNYVSSSSAPLAQVVNQNAAAGYAVTAANATTTVGTADPLTFSIPVITGSQPPQGTVAFTSGTTNLGTATWPTTPTTGPCPGGTGTCYLLQDTPSPTNIPLTTAPATSTPVTATFTATATSGYSSGTANTNVAVSAAGGSGDTLSVANNPTTYGTADTLTFSVPVSSGAPAPAGTVVFSAGGVALGSATWPANPVATGGSYTISVSPTNIPVGAPTTVTAAFTATGASGYGSASPTANVTVTKVPLSNDGISANPSATTSGSTVTLTFTVPTVNNTPPSGTATVTFTYNGTTLGTANLFGTTSGTVTTYTTTTTALPVGSDTVTGTFTGDGDYTGGALTTPVAISSNTTTDTVAVGTNPTTVGASDTITFSIPVGAGTPAVPTGTVTFTSGSTNLGTATWPATPTAVGGFYTLQISTTSLPLTVAPSTSTPVLATYAAGGTSGYASTTATTTVVVNQVSGTTDAVTASNATIAVGTADPLTFSIPVATGAPVPTGTVVFTSGGTALGSASWPAAPATGSCPVGGGSCYLLADAPSPSNIPLTVAPSTSTPILATYTSGSGSGYSSSAPTTQVVVTPVTGATDTLSVSNNPTTYGTADTLTFSIPVSSGAPAPAGTVTFASGTTALGSATWPTNPTPTNGFYTISVSPLNIPVGAPTTVTATFAPTSASGYATASPSATVTVNKVPLSSDGIAANPSATTSGQTVTLTFTVPNQNGTVPTGTVTFSYNGTTLGTGALTGTTTGGVTTYTTTTTSLPVGTDTITGTFTGDGTYAGGALTTPVAISSNATTDTVTVGTNPTTVGVSDTITFSIPVAAGTPAAPTGTVTFTSGSTTLGTATWPAAPVAVGGFYTLQTSTTLLPLTVAPSKSTPVLATYAAGGTSGYASATATTTVVVNQVSGTTDAVTAANATIAVGTADPLTFSIPVTTGAPVPTGTVVFTSGTTALGSATWPATPTTGACPGGGAGTCYLLADTPSPSNIPLTVAPATSTPITATYTAGTGSGYASSAPTTQVDVTPVGGTGGTLTIANNPTVYGTADPMTFSLPVSTGVPAPAGTVTFTAGGVTLGAAVWPATPVPVGGFYTISISPTTTPVGSPTLVTATFTPTGSSGYAASAPTANVTVAKAPLSSDTITAAPNPATSGQSVTLTFTVPTVNSTPPAGTVTFSYNGTTLGTANVTGTTVGNVTTYTTTTSALPVGTDTVTGTFSGDGNYAGGALTTGETVTQTSGTGDTVSVSTNPTTVGSADTITFSIPVSAGANAPTGTVTFTSGGTQLGQATWPAAPVAAGGSYTLTISTSSLPLTVAPATSTPVTATFAAGNTSGYASAAPTTTVVVNQVSGATDALSVANNPTTVGTADPITYSIPVVAGAPIPAGTVTFSSGTTALGSATWPATPVTGACPTGGGACYVLADAPTPTNLPLTTAPATTTPVSATFAATAGSGYASATANTTVVVNASNGSGDTVTVANNPTTYGTADPITFHIPVSPGAPAPTGTVTFTATGGVALGAATWPAAPTAVGGFYTVSISPSNLPVGSTTVTATYAPGANSGYGSAAPTVAVTVNPVPLTSDSITSSPNPQSFNSPVVLTFTVPVVNGTAPAAASTVTFTATIGGVTTVLGTGPVTGTTVGAVTTYTTSTMVLPVGANTVTGTFTGDGNYAGGPLTTVETITQTNSTATLAAGPNPATFGTPVTLTETIAPIGGTCPAGPATFYNNTAVIGTGAMTLNGGSCVATLTTSTLPVGTDSITATVPASGGFVAITSGPVALVINQANSPDVLTSNPNPSVFGSPVVITDTIPIAVTGVPPTGTVNFYDFTTLIGTGTVNSSGVATITTSTLPVGTDSLTAVYLGDPNYAQITTAPVNQVVTPISTTATLAVGPNPANFGTSVSLTETIPVTNGTPATGSVTFYSNGTQVGTGTLVNGVATISSSTLPVGADPITATYNGDTNYGAVTSGPVVETINKANGADTLTVAPDPAVFGNTVTITDTVPVVGGVAPTGTVTFYNNGTSIGTGTVNAAGVATLTTTTLPVGSDPITATYGGDTNYAPVTSGPVNEVVTVGNTTPVLGATPNPTTFGTTVTLTESIPGINGIVPTGTVIFSDNGTAIGTAPVVNGVATLTTSTLPIGTDPITATYSGDGTYGTANSGPLNVVINKAAPTDTLTANPNPSVFGSPVTLTFSVPPVNGVAPTGTVSFYNGTTLLGTGTVNAQGVATITTSQLPFGTDTVTATYPGDNNYAPANPSTTIAVSQVTPVSVVTGPTGSPACGSSVTLTDTITGVNGVALGGTVQFFDNGVAIGSPIPVPATGVVTLTTTSLPCTTDSITAVYTPPSNSPYLPSTGGPLSVNVLTPDFMISATPPNQTINPGDSTTYTVSLSGVGAPFTSPVTLTATGLPPGATVTFANPTYVPGAGPTSTTMTILTAPNQATLKHTDGNANEVFYGLLLLPLLGLRRVRRTLRALPKGVTYCVAALLLLGGLGAMTGCGGGYFGPAPQTFTITVTGTSGSLNHSTTVTLTVR